LIDFAAIYSRENRTKFLLIGAALIVAIAVLDKLTPNVPLGFLYLFPVLLVSGFLSRWEIIAVAAVCTTLTTIFSDYPLEEALSFSVMCWTGMSGTGLFVSEIVRGRQLALEHQEELRALVESSPLAIMTFVPSGRILLANQAAQNLLAPCDDPVSGQPIAEFLPTLQTVVRESGAKVFRTELRCRGRRKNGETFLAGVWVSTSLTSRGPMVAAFVVDLSQDLREREDESLQLLLTNAKILMGAMAHEVRNLCGAVRLTYRNLSRLPAVTESEDFRALGTLIEGLERLSSINLQSEAHEASFVELASVLDELRVIIEPAYREAGMEIVWQLPEDRPLVRAERYG